ncbi:MAG: ribonuclease III [Planctomycetaceae bacterium]
MSSIDEILSLCETRIGYQFRDRTLLRRCLTHSSSAETRLDSNERLEFLGDAVLGLVICDHLFQLYPEQREGQLTQMKSYLVSRQVCARVARLLEIAPLILVGRGLQSIPESILSAVIESLIAGIYFDGGLSAARDFILFGFREELALCRPLDTENFKSQLQEYTQRELGTTPEYLLVEETGPDHAREFGVAARVKDAVFEIGRGRSKKEAEQHAARNAVLSLQRLESESKSTVICCDSGTCESVECNIVGEENNVPQTEFEIVMVQVADQMTTEIVFSHSTRTCDSQNCLEQNTAMKANVDVKMIEAEVLFRPESAALRFLPEGPYSLGHGRMSWVGIQHGADSTVGSINILNLGDGTNRTFDLPGRPGFAFPTDRPGVFVTGYERSVGLFDTISGQFTPLVEGLESAVSNTIINDAVVYDGNLIFGCKELEFKTKKAGLYLWRRSDGKTIQLRNDQICSNGKAVISDASGNLTLFDIDSCTKQITRCSLDISEGTVGPLEVIVDLTSESVFPDGMLLTPDHKSLIVALYDPGDPAAGAARQYSIATGELEVVWACPGSPRVTCPQLIERDGQVCLVLTSAVEHMPPEQSEKHPNAGCLFIGATSFASIGDQPIFPCP